MIKHLIDLVGGLPNPPRYRRGTDPDGKSSVAVSGGLCGSAIEINCGS
ncbi:MAG: hypothetical protein VB064_13010 [Oscillospiraceae bacterium]|nr:hypothetical protein [Oscillospiraceae bacterium]